MIRHIGTAIFLMGCLLGGVWLGRLFLHPQPASTHSTPAVPRIIGGALPAARGIHTALTLDSPLAEWKREAARDAGLGANRLLVETTAEGFDAAQAASLVQIVHAGRDAGLKTVLIANVTAKIVNSAAGSGPAEPIAFPPPMNSCKAIMSAAEAADVDMLALDPHLGDTEPDDEAWSAFIRQFRDQCTVPLCYVADYDGCPRVTWWQLVDYIGVSRPVELDDPSGGATIDQLKMSWTARQDMILSLSTRDKRPVFLFNIEFGPPPSSQDARYQAALDATCGQDRLGGVFMRLPADGAGAERVQKAIREKWHTNGSAGAGEDAGGPVAEPRGSATTARSPQVKE